MINAKKYEHPHGYNCYEIETNEGKFEINYQGNLDLYWRYPCNKENIQKADLKITGNDESTSDNRSF